MKKNIINVLAVMLVTVVMSMFGYSSSNIPIQTKQRRIMVVLDRKDVVHEILDYEIEYCIRSSRRKAITISQGTADVTYPFEKIEEIQSEIVKTGESSAFGRWNLKLKLVTGETIISEDNGGSGCVVILGKNSTGGDVKIYLSATKKITFKD